MRIVDLEAGDERTIADASAVLYAGFAEHVPEAWPTIEDALEKVHESLGPERICRAAVDERGAVLGWVGAMPSYGGCVWELHPLVVRPQSQGQGIGSALVADLEERVRARGGITMILGTDDKDGTTTLYGVDLYPDPLAHLARIVNLGRHPYEFYQKLGYVLVGVVPDANGWGKPDICLAKRL